MIESDRIIGVMGGELGQTLFALGNTVSEGLPKTALRNTVKHVFAEPSDQWNFLYRVVPEATFKRRRDRLNLVESERTERIARVIATAEYVLEDRELAREFLTRAHPLLKGKTPMEASLTELGARQVEEMLFSVAYGLPA
jgi:putative toxin-antitoxin system antitoxin component (TIGR02293 family)